MANNSGENGFFGKFKQMHTFSNLLHTLKMKFAETTQTAAKVSPITYVCLQQQPIMSRKIAQNAQATRQSGEKSKQGCMT